MQIAAQWHGQDLNSATSSLPVAPPLSHLWVLLFLLVFGNFRTILREELCQILALYFKVTRVTWKLLPRTESRPQDY